MMSVRPTPDQRYGRSVTRKAVADVKMALGDVRELSGGRIADDFLARCSYR
jgi:hypothetical protein